MRVSLVFLIALAFPPSFGAGGAEKEIPDRPTRGPLATACLQAVKWIGRAGITLKKKQKGTDASLEPAKPGVAGTSEPALRTKPIPQVSPNESGLTDVLIGFGTDPNYRPPFKDRLEALQSLARQIERAPLDHNFALSLTDLKLIDALRKTNLGKKNEWAAVIAAVNEKIEPTSRQRGVEIDTNFLEGLLEVKAKLEKASAKLDALAASHIEFKEYGDKIAYNPHTEEAKGAWDGVKEVFGRYGLYAKTPVAESDIPKIDRYLSGFLDDKTSVYDGLSESIRLLKRFDQENGTKHYERIAAPVFSKTLDLLDEYKDPMGSAALNASYNSEKLSWAAAAILLDPPKGSLGPISAKFLEEYRNGRTTGLAAILKYMYHFDDEKVETYRILEEQLLRIKADPTIKDKADFAESLYLGFVSASLKRARWAETSLSKGLGFHNAIRVSTAAEEAAKATEIFDQLGLRGSQTARLNTAALAKIFRGLKYDSLGRRALGDEIGYREAFGIQGAERKERTDPYNAINAYLMHQMAIEGKAPQGLLELLQSDNEAPK